MTEIRAVCSADDDVDQDVNEVQDSDRMRMMPAWHILFQWSLSMFKPGKLYGAGSQRFGKPPNFANRPLTLLENCDQQAL